MKLFILGITFRLIMGFITWMLFAVHTSHLVLTYCDMKHWREENFPKRNAGMISTNVRVLRTIQKDLIIKYTPESKKSMIYTVINRKRILNVWRISLKILSNLLALNRNRVTSTIHWKTLSVGLETMMFRYWTKIPCMLLVNFGLARDFSSAEHYILTSSDLRECYLVLLGRTKGYLAKH